jgi:hypothetical protein
MLKVSFVQGRITPDIVQKWFSDIKAETLQKRQTSQLSHPDHPTSSKTLPTLQERLSTSSLTSSISHISTEHQQQSTSNYDFNISAQFKIIVCGPMNMIISVEQTLIGLDYSEKNYILLI